MSILLVIALVIIAAALYAHRTTGTNAANDASDSELLVQPASAELQQDTIPEIIENLTIDQSSAPVSQKPKVRKRNLQYFYKSKGTGNVYPAEYRHMNNYIDFNVAGVNYRGDLSDYIGEFEGRLVPEPDNEHDSNAIRVEHQNGKQIGYVPKTITTRVREFKELPCDCYCYIERRKDEWGNKYFLALCYVTDHPFGE